MKELTQKELDERFKGYTDCKEGNTVNINGSEHYKQGYACQYEWEQMLAHITIKRERIH